jgi:hypothetical protein
VDIWNLRFGLLAGTLDLGVSWNLSKAGATVEFRTKIAWMPNGRNPINTVDFLYNDPLYNNKFSLRQYIIVVHAETWNQVCIEINSYYTILPKMIVPRDIVTEKIDCIEFHQEWPKFAQISQKSTSFGRKILKNMVLAVFFWKLSI